MPFVESLTEFAERQRCTPLTVRSRYLFPNGAQSDGYTHAEPPADAVAQLRLRHEYAQAQLDTAIKRFSRDRDAIAEQADFHRMGAGPMPAPGWEEHLQKLVAEIEQLQGQVQSLAAQLPVNVAEQQYMANRNQQRQRAGEVVAALQQLPTF